MRIARLVAEVTDDKSLPKAERKRLQIERARQASPAAQQLKIADKLCNLRDIVVMPPADWSAERKREYFVWAKSVVDRVRRANPRLAKQFDMVHRASPID